VNGGENRLALRSYMLTCLNQHSAAVAEWSKAVLRLRNATMSISVYVTGWCAQTLKRSRATKGCEKIINILSKYPHSSPSQFKHTSRYFYPHSSPSQFKHTSRYFILIPHPSNLNVRVDIF